MSRGELLLYVVLPYAALAIFFVGHLWRYRRDQYGWGARSTQLLESRVLKYASTIFHLGVLAAIGGHVLGILIPKSWTEALGLSDSAYHVIAVIGGIAAGSAVCVGFALLVYRRLRFARVRVTTTRADVVTFGLLGLGIVTGMLATLTNIGDVVHYRESVGPYFRNLMILNPKPELMTGERRDVHLPGARDRRLATGCVLALQPAGARLERAGRLPAAQPSALPQPEPAAEAPAPSRRRHHRGARPPMKRSDELAPLSRDHHQALFVAMKLKRAEADGAEAFLGFIAAHGGRPLPDRGGDPPPRLDRLRPGSRPRSRRAGRRRASRASRGRTPTARARPRRGWDSGRRRAARTPRPIRGARALSVDRSRARSPAARGARRRDRVRRGCLRAADERLAGLGTTSGDGVTVSDAAPLPALSRAPGARERSAAPLGVLAGAAVARVRSAAAAQRVTASDRLQGGQLPRRRAAGRCRRRP